MYEKISGFLNLGVSSDISDDRATLPGTFYDNTIII
jgi:hypothetical protein